MARASQERQDYFDERSHETTSESDHDEQIRKAPYLPRVQIWAREGGPYTLRVGHQWFHCDDLIINGAEYDQKSRSRGTNQSKYPHNSSSANQPATASQRPKPSSARRAQSYQRTRPDKQPTTSASQVAGADKSGTHNQYQPQSLPTPKEQAEKRRSERRQREKLEAPKQAYRERHDSGTASVDDTPSYGALVKYSNPPPTTSAQTNAPSSRPTRPSVPRRGSSRNNSYSIPVRSKARKNVRFAALPR